MTQSQQSERTGLVGDVLPLVKTIVREPIKDAVREVLQEEGLVSSGGAGADSGPSSGSRSTSGSGDGGGSAEGSSSGSGSGGRSLVVPLVILGAVGAAYALKKRGGSSAGPRSDESSDIAGLAEEVGSKITATVGGGTDEGSTSETDADDSDGDSTSDSSDGDDTSEESQEDAPTASS